MQRITSEGREWGQDSALSFGTPGFEVASKGTLTQ